MLKASIYTLFTFLIFFVGSIPLKAQDGKALFRSTCAACHTLDQNLVGPALNGVTERRETEWLYSFIRNSQAMIRDGDPIAVELYQKFNQVPMPPHNMSDEEIASILDYIEGASEEAVAAAAEAAANPIKRPDEFYGANYRQFTFTDYIFWIPGTIVIFILIATLLAFTYTYDSLKEARGETVIPQEEL